MSSKTSSPELAAAVWGQGDDARPWESARATGNTRKSLGFSSFFLPLNSLWQNFRFSAQLTLGSLETFRPNPKGSLIQPHPAIKITSSYFPNIKLWPPWNRNAFLKCTYRFCWVKPTIFFKSSDNASFLVKQRAPRHRPGFPPPPSGQVGCSFKMAVARNSGAPFFCTYFSPKQD